MMHLNHLPHQRRDENVILLLRRHWFVLARQLVLYLLVGFLPLVIWAYLNSQFPNLLENPAVASVFALLLFAFYLFLLLFIYHTWVDYYLDVWMVTNHRVLNIELEGLFKRAVSEHPLFRIQDVTTEQIGFFEHFLRYGEVSIQQVPQPEKVSRQITQLIAWHKKAYPDEHK
jgi:membrane protein YdbS with pleckstrin-like domain